jgi:hypothetical protein
LARFREVGSSLWRSTPSTASATSIGIPRTGEGGGSTSMAGLVAEGWSSTGSLVHGRTHTHKMFDALRLTYDTSLFCLRG